MSIPLFDCHCDTIVPATINGEGLRKNSLHLDLDRLSKFSPSAQVFAICTGFLKDADCSADKYLKKLIDELNENSDMVYLCLNSADLDTARHNNKIAAFISLEGAEQMPSPETAYNAGIRIIHPTWNYDNEISGAEMGSGTGLTELGKDLVLRAQELGMLLDMSHISVHGFWDVIELSRKPVIAGHSNSRRLCDHPRNLDDTQFKALVSLGGGAGINLYPEFLGFNRDIDAVIAHIEYFLSLGGEKCVFLGCDFDGIEITPAGLNGVEDLEKLYDALLKRNYNESLVRDIFFNNIYEIIRRTL